MPHRGNVQSSDRSRVQRAALSSLACGLALLLVASPAQAAECLGKVTLLSPRTSDGGSDIFVETTSCACTSTGGPNLYAFTLLGNNGNRLMSYSNALSALLAAKTVKVDYLAAGSSPSTAFCVAERVVIYR